MIRHYITKVSGGFRLSRPDVMVCVPAGATSTERRAVIDATLAAGARAAYIIREPVAAAIGAGIPIASAAGNMVVDIGGGTTEIAILSLGGVVAQHSIRVGGNRLDTAIADYIRRTYGLAIGDRTAEVIKQQLGTALMLTRDKPWKSAAATSSPACRKPSASKPTKSPVPSKTSSKKSSRPSASCLSKPRRSSRPTSSTAAWCSPAAVRSCKTSTKCSPQVTGVPCVVAEEPLLCVARGTGIALDNLEEYKRSLVAVR